MKVLIFKEKISGSSVNYMATFSPELRHYDFGLKDGETRGDILSTLYASFQTLSGVKGRRRKSTNYNYNYHERILNSRWGESLENVLFNSAKYED